MTHITHQAMRAASVAPRRRATGTLVAGLGLMLLVSLTGLSLFVGSGDINPAEAWAALLGDGSSTTELLVREYRVPRTLLAILVGIALGLSGVVIQALTRNPLADPGILGVNAGAYTAVVFGAAFLGSTVTASHVWIAMGGALIASLLVYAIGTSGTAGHTATKLVLTGVAFGAVLSGISFAVTLMLPEVFDRVRFWSAGSLQGRTFDTLWAVLPFIAAGTFIALMMPRALNAMSLGDDVAVALGSRPLLTRLAGVASVTLLCGAATAAAGPIAFVGLMVPHALRSIVGPDHRRLVPLSLLAAPALMLAADVLGRVVISSELPVGVVTAFIGAPLLIAITRRSAVRAL